MPKKSVVVEKYAAAPGAMFSDEQAELIGQELDRMEAEGIPVATEYIVERAKSAKSPLHNFFTWDIQEAAAKQWKSEAQHLTNHLVKVTVTAEGEIRTKARWNVVQVIRIGEEQHNLRSYVQASVVQSDPALREQVSAQAVRELRTFYQKYTAFGLDGLEKVFDAIETIL